MALVINVPTSKKRVRWEASRRNFDDESPAEWKKPRLDSPRKKRRLPHKPISTELIAHILMKVIVQKSLQSALPFADGVFADMGTDILACIVATKRFKLGAVGSQQKAIAAYVQVHFELSQILCEHSQREQISAEESKMARSLGENLKMHIAPVLERQTPATDGFQEAKKSDEGGTNVDQEGQSMGTGEHDADMKDVASIAPTFPEEGAGYEEREAKATEQVVLLETAKLHISEP